MRPAGDRTLRGGSTLATMGGHPGTGPGTARPPRTGSALRRAAGRHPHLTITPLLLVGTVVMWELSIRWFAIDPYLVPSPGEVGQALAAGARKGPTAPDGWYYNAYVTGSETLLGFLAGSAIGVLLAVLVSSSRVAERTLVPFVVAFQSVPKIAVAPLFVVWFGLGISSKVWLTVAVIFFPVFVNTLSGFASVPPDSRLLMRAFGASRAQTIRHLVIPSALPSMFAGLEVALIFSLTAAVVGEFMGGSEGLGSFIIIQQSMVDIPGVFAALIVLGVMGTAMNALLRLLRRRVLYWMSDTSVMGI